MNKDDILNMPAGREMDALVAEKVMGWKLMRWTHYSEREPVIIGKASDEHWPPIPNFSTDIAAACEVVEKIKGEDCYIHWGYVGGYNDLEYAWCVRIMNFKKADYEQAIEATLPLAICKTALLATLEGELLDD